MVNDANVFGPRSVAVPGSVAGLCLALERWGTMDLADVIAPAIKLAEEGFIPDLHVALHTAISCQELAAFPSTARTYLRDGNYVYRTSVVNDGDIFRQPDLARSLRLLAKEGPSAFYTGAIAQAIHEEMAATGGMLTRDDLARYAPRVLPALTGTYRGLELAFSPGATGGTTALEMLNPVSQVAHDVEDTGRTPPPRRGHPPGLSRSVRASGRSRACQGAMGRASLARVCRQGRGGPQAEAPAQPPSRSRSVALRDDGPRRRLHHAPVRRRSQAEHGLADEHRCVALGISHGRSRDGHPAPERHGLV